MSVRRLSRLTRIGSKAVLSVGAVYLYHSAGLWKGSDETIENYEKLKKQGKHLYGSTPQDFQKWVDYASSSADASIQPYVKAVGDFRKDWLNFDLSFIREEGDGIVRPLWNRGVDWTIDVVKNSPQTMQSLALSGWNKVNEMLDSTTTPNTSFPSKQ